MRKYTLIFLALALVACKTDSKKEEMTTVAEAEPVEAVASYPDALHKVFNAHGGLKAWKEQRTLTYDLPKKDMTETHTTDLWTRNDRIDTQNFSMGSDAGKVWLLDADENYKGDAVFYHNLMFYFYAMPFVLADEGINYGEAEDLVFEGKNYPGIRISYNTGVGTSPKDEYFIHYDADTHEMTWLGYTVTYRTGEISENVKWIRYDDWQEVDGLKLPKSITWYNYEGMKILDARSTVQFDNVTLSGDAKSADFYAKPDAAISVEPKTYE